MSIEVWFVFSLAYLVVTFSPGPNVLLVLKNSVQFGWKSAFVTVLGNLSCQLIIVFLVAVGVGQLLHELPVWFTVLKVVGGVYLIYLGWKALASSGAGRIKRRQEKETVEQKNLGKLFVEAFFVSASNPKTIVFLSAFLPQFLVTDKPYIAQFVVMYISICLIVLSVHLGYSYTISRVGQSLLIRDFEQKLSKISGWLFVGIGSSVLVEVRSKI